MTIVHVLGSFEVGGAEQVALNLASAQAKEHRVHVVSLSPPPDGPHAESFARAGVTVHREPKRGRAVDPTLLLRLTRLFRRLRASVIHTHNPLTLIYAGPAARAAGTVLVHTKHGFNQTTSRRTWLRRIAGQLPHRVVAVSEQTAEDARAQRDYPAGRLEVIPNGIDLSAYAPDPLRREQVRRELHIPLDAFVMGTVGRMTPVKNQEHLVRAAGPLLDENVHLVLVGDGPCRAAIETAARQTPRPASVHLLGQRLDVARLLRALDLFVLPSKNEGLPMVLPEAMACGVAVLGTSVGGVPEVIEHGRSGFLVPPNDERALRAQLASLISEPERIKACSARGREVALRDYTADRMVTRYMALYRTLLARR